MGWEHQVQELVTVRAHFKGHFGTLITALHVILKRCNQVGRGTEQALRVAIEVVNLKVELARLCPYLVRNAVAVVEGSGQIVLLLRIHRLMAPPNVNRPGLKVLVLDDD